MLVLLATNTKNMKKEVKEVKKEVKVSKPVLKVYDENSPEVLALVKENSCYNVETAVITLNAKAEIDFNKAK